MHSRNPFLKKVFSAFPLFSCMLLSAKTTFSFSVSNYVQICSGKFMTPNAMSFPRINSCGTLATSYISFLRNCLKVLGVYATTISAKMVNNQSSGDFSHVDLVRKSMGPHHFIIESYNAVAVLIAVSLPFPANPFLYFRKEVLNVWRVSRWSLFHKLPYTTQRHWGTL